MNDLLDALAFFHFLRPGWLVLILPALVLWWHVRARATVRPDLPVGLAPHLSKALSVGADHRLRPLAIDGVVATLVLASLATAGPTWSRVPSPFVSQTAPLAIALSTSQSMLAVDVAPNRLERAKHKLLDLLDARAGARTALIAYAGTAHRVVPLTEDPEVLKPFIEGLLPEVMPEDGHNATAALALARESRLAEPIPGAILFVLDELDGADIPAFEKHAREGGVGIVFLSVGGTDEAHDLLERVPGSSLVSLTPDTSDIRQIERRVASAYRDALARDDRQQWEDRGWVLAWPAALLTLIYFRRGWTISLGIVLALGLMGVSPGPAHADGLASSLESWFLTPDQRGRLAYEDGRFEEAAKAFQDPLWKGYALYFIGRYPEAAATLARVASADAAFAQGMALVKGREYRPGITAFEAALERDPEHIAAAHNLEVARAILSYLERQREQSDTDEGSEGADEVVFDKEADGGTEQTMSEKDRIKIESAEQWMRTVETRTSDFLRIRFALEAAEADR
ncbi:MAG: VWA domain-containing protein [Deltaproteobacteria bacterium]|nr:VWA domain-containing protein [Deltaproteobacteria bacterium]